jgi:hypothetical protein
MMDYTILEMLKAKLERAVIEYENQTHDSLRRIQKKYVKFLEDKINERYSRLV